MRERELGIITLIEESDELAATDEPVAVAAGSAAADDVTEEAGK
jgi:hypothetical protein